MNVQTQTLPSPAASASPTSCSKCHLRTNSGNAASLCRGRRRPRRRHFTTNLRLQPAAAPARFAKPQPRGTPCRSARRRSPTTGQARGRRQSNSAGMPMASVPLPRERRARMERHGDHGHRGNGSRPLHLGDDSSRAAIPRRTPAMEPTLPALMRQPLH